MSGPCTRPECGGELHTDPWGTPVQCPHSEPAATDTGRRCPRCDCPDGHEQCDHCKTCPHAEQSQQLLTVPVDATSSWVVAEPTAPTIAILGEDNRTPLVTIHPNGTLEYGPDYTPDEAAHRFWEALSGYAPRALSEAQAAIERVRAVLAERLAEVAEHEADGMLPFGTPGASWCDAVTVTCARVEDVLRPKTTPTGVPAEPDPQETP